MLTEREIAESEDIDLYQAAQRAKRTNRVAGRHPSRPPTIQPELPDTDDNAISTAAEDTFVPLKPRNLNVTGTIFIEVANAPIRLRAGGGKVTQLTVYTPGNTSTLYIGGPGVNTTTGFPIPKNTGPLLMGAADLDTLWVIGATVGDSLSFVGMRED